MVRTTFYLLGTRHLGAEEGDVVQIRGVTLPPEPPSIRLARVKGRAMSTNLSFALGPLTILSGSRKDCSCKWETNQNLKLKQWISTGNVVSRQ
jgi:hypothetical protein